MEKQEKGLLSRVKQNLILEQVFWETEIEANIQVAKSLLAGSLCLAVCWILNIAGVLAIGDEFIMKIFIICLAAVLVPAVIALAIKGEKKWAKHMLIGAAVVVFAYMDSLLTYNVPLIIVIPVILSCRYFSVRFTVLVAAATTTCFAISAYVGAKFVTGSPDMNFYEGSMTEYVKDVMILSFLPKWMIFIVITTVCIAIAACGRNMVRRQDAIARSNARIETELEMARKIQGNALPLVERLPESEIREFDLAATMNPAKEVAGDFYDFLYVDDRHLALIIADVADKGIAAAMYMMMSKMMLDNKLTVISSPGKVLEEVNNQLCQRTTKGMFVTVWLGVVDLETGDMVTANAGHEYPVIKRKDGSFELFKDKHGFVLGGMSDLRYKESFIHLSEGDILYVYTDGVPEANNRAGEMFGNDRMIAALNESDSASMSHLIADMSGKVNEFSGDAPQFDDMTMVAFSLKGLKEKKTTADAGE